MADITLSAAVRSNLLALASTARLIDRTQDRLSTGLRVNSPVDDAKAFFESKALSDRAATINEKKDGIDQAVSAVSVALEAVNSLDSIVEQLKGIVNSASSAGTAAEFTELNAQYNSLIAQIDNLAADSTYQGTNLVNGTGSTLTVSFSNTTTSNLTIDSVDLRKSGLGLATGATLSAATSRATAIVALDGAIATLDAKAKTLGSNVALLQTRLDFSAAYANELQAGADKLVLADITEEGANLVALQTRQQLGISSLSFAGTSEQSILSLFR
ncbi:MAG: flagellin [Alphaproteobacteria bacterium]|jgi:flagellin